MNEDLKERIDGAVESMENDADNEGCRWTLPNGQNCLIISPTGHLAVVHDASLRGWLSTMKEAGETIAKLEAEVASLRAPVDVDGAAMAAWCALDDNTPETFAEFIEGDDDDVGRLRNEVRAVLAYAGKIPAVPS